jgi:hypothetical protein
MKALLRERGCATAGSSAGVGLRCHLTSTASKLSNPSSFWKWTVGVTFFGSTFSKFFRTLRTRSVTSFLSRNVCAEEEVG